MEDKYIAAKENRQKFIDAVLNSESKKNIVVAGPGTGKTYLFQKILSGKKNALTLTFVNALIDDLSLELCGLSDVMTLHGFARSVLNKATSTNVKIYPKLSEVIKDDAKILLGQEIDFDFIFNNRDDNNINLEFYKKRKDYYEKCYGYSDVIFAAVKYFETQKKNIPTYDQILVDEFQDFNILETSLIELLAEKSPITLAGDDDQTLYGFKYATPENIRKKYDLLNKEYSSFTLPYCSRCTKVIIEATNDFIKSAMTKGHLKNRVLKEYKYFDDKDKDKIGQIYPKITYAQLFAKQIPWFIEKSLEEIAIKEKKAFSVLVISPTKIQIRDISNALKIKGFKNVQFSEKNAEKNPTAIEGLKILIENKKSNLGWRILAKLLLNNHDYEEVLKTTDSDKNPRICDLVEKPFKTEVESLLKIAVAIKNGKAVLNEDLDKLFRVIGMKPYDMVADSLRKEVFIENKKGGNPGLKKIPIKATTVQSSKGLSADYVFITHFDDQYFIRSKDKNAVSDQEICNFLVALTRAKKKVYLISSDIKKQPSFLSWIGTDKLEVKSQR